MSTIPTGTHLFAYISYASDKLAPQLHFLNPETQKLAYFSPQSQVVTLDFDTSQRYCTGWHDLASQATYPCPDAAPVNEKFHECHHCQQKTGFNPAFYHADAISPQQQARNQQPHTLYLAHFAPGVVKVGITYAGRGIRRLLDQGARSCLILKTFPTADIARQYEAKIAALPDILETLQSRQKIAALGKPYTPHDAAQELHDVRERIAQDVGLTSEKTEAVRHLDPYYFGQNTLTTSMQVDMTKENHLSGRVVGLIGGILVTEQDDTHFLFNLNKRRGYHATISHTETPNQHTPQQASLF